MKKAKIVLDEKEKSKLIEIISKARGLNSGNNTKVTDISSTLDELTPYVKRSKTEEYYLFEVAKYHEERLRQAYKEKTGTNYKPKE